MKILITTQFLLEGSGSGIYVQNEARELAALGHEVRVLAATRGDTKKYPFALRGIAFHNGDNSASCDFDVPYFTTHPLSSCRFADLSDVQLTHYVNILKCALDEELSSFAPDLVHVHHASILAYHMASRQTPYVITLHGTDLMGFAAEERFHSFVLPGVQRAFANVAISRQIADEAKRLLSISDGRLTLIHNGCDEAIFYPRDKPRSEVLSRFGIRPDSAAAVVSFVGKLASYKGVDLLIRAAEIYRKDCGDVITLICGDGELRAELEMLTRTLGIQGIHFLGHQSQDSAAEVYSIADVSVVPSRHEPFGLVAVEALACGTPVIGTNGGGLPDFITPDVGTLVPMEDWNALGTAISNEIRSGGKKRKGGFAAQYAREEFSWKVTFRKLEALFRAALPASDSAAKSASSGAA